MSLTVKQFSKRILAWFDQHGRKHLPWQQPISAYRVWLSEIMLQQTQVATVIPYFERFVQRFPDIQALAAASLDEVLYHWAGLGYYARARHLHQTAQRVVQDFNGEFPAELDALQQLPGIGRSTAGAILAIAFGQQAAILDGNVKRVLARYHAVAGWPGASDVLKQLWHYAEQYTPFERVADYTQAMMDLGAMVCTRSSPRCPECPLQGSCVAYQRGEVTAYPGRKTSKPLPIRHVYMLLVRNSQGEILLQKRPPVGIWGGLWSLPECADENSLWHWRNRYLANQVVNEQIFTRFRHTFSHYHLDISAILLELAGDLPLVAEAEQYAWYHAHDQAGYGLAKPAKQLLSMLAVGAPNGSTSQLSEIT